MFPRTPGPGPGHRGCQLWKGPELCVGETLVFGGLAACQPPVTSDHGCAMNGFLGASGAHLFLPPSPQPQPQISGYFSLKCHLFPANVSVTMLVLSIKRGSLISTQRICTSSIFLSPASRAWSRAGTCLFASCQVPAPRTYGSVGETTCMENGRAEEAITQCVIMC